MDSQVFIGEVAIELISGDISRQEVDVIVNAANSRLAGGGGVDGAIHRAAGPSVMEETNRRYPNGCATGDAVISAAGNLSAKHIVHAVGPVWRNGNSGEAALLASAYERSLELATANQCDSIALPALSTGAYRYPLAAASRVALATAIDYAQSHSRPGRIRFVLFTSDALEEFQRTLAELIS